MLPSPTAEPTVAAITPNFVAKLSLLLLIFFNLMVQRIPGRRLSCRFPLFFIPNFFLFLGYGVGVEPLNVDLKPLQLFGRLLTLIFRHRFLSVAPCCHTDYHHGNQDYTDDAGTLNFRQSFHLFEKQFCDEHDEYEQRCHHANQPVEHARHSRTQCTPVGGLVEEE